jgi:two-component system sensor histidine kinase/response regulator
VASGLPLNIFFSLLNLVEKKPILSVINLFLFLGGIIILVINSYRKLLLGRLVLTFLGSVLFTAEAILFRNGAEYYLITNLVVIIIYFNEKKYIVFISLFNCLVFVGIKAFLSYSSYSYDTISLGRVMFNTVWALMMLFVALLFFKREQMTYQWQVEEKNKELEKLNDTKEKLFSIIAHDLRSPIGQLKNSLDLVSREHMSPEAFRQISAKLSSEVDHLHSTLDNLLRWSVSQLQGITALPERTALSDVIEKQATFFKQSFEQKNISFRQENISSFVLADPDHLMLIIRNLVSNAIKYSYPDSYITIRSQSENGRVIIEVSDTGMGMNETIQASLFSNGHMVSSTGTSNEKGTGLGLKLCKEFIEKNNGELWVESVEQKGTSFYISLPEAN